MEKDKDKIKIGYDEYTILGGKKIKLNSKVKRYYSLSENV
jgi:hypothetical protein